MTGRDVLALLLLGAIIFVSGIVVDVAGAGLWSIVAAVGILLGWQLGLTQGTWRR